MLATFSVWAADAGIWAVNRNVRGALPVGFTEPSEQVIVIRSELAVQPLGSVDTTALVAGSSLSVSTTFVAVVGPGLLTVTVYVTKLFGATKETFAGECEISRHSLEPHAAELVAVNHVRAHTMVTSRHAPVKVARRAA
jgi:hypothetical protein